MKEDDILIRLQRKYGKDELVASLNKQIKELNITIGTLRAEIEFLEHELLLTKSNKKIEKQALLDCRKEELYQNILTMNDKLRKENKTWKNQRDTLITKLNKK